MPRRFTVNTPLPPGSEAHKSQHLKWSSSLTFDNQDGRGGQALHVGVNKAHVFPAVVQLDVANHQISRNALEGKAGVGQNKVK